MKYVSFVTPSPSGVFSEGGDNYFDTEGLFDAGFVMSNHLWLRVYSLSRVSTNGG